MNVQLRKVTRNPWSTLILLMLLVLSIIVTSISYPALLNCKFQFEQINKQYTTIAIPSGLNQEKLFTSGTYYSIGVDSKKFSDGTKYIGPIDAENTARGSDYYRYSDYRTLLSAHVEGGKPITSGTLDPLEYNFTLDTYCYQLSVMALQCISIETDITYGETAAGKSYWAGFQIVDDVSRIDAYNLPPYEDVLYLAGRLYTRDGNVPFEIGKTYLIRGRYWDYDIVGSYQWIVNEDGEDQIAWVLERDLNADFKNRTLIFNTEYPLHTGLGVGETTGVTNGLPNWTLEWKQNIETGEYFCTTPEDCWPYYAEYEGSWQDFLETTGGQVWKDEIIPNFEMNHSSVPVILTDNIHSMYAFNSGDVSILEGSAFSDDDYRNGNNVCLVSAAYAQVNDLSVGDTINLDYYNTTYEARTHTLGAVGGRQGMTIVRTPLTWNTRIDVQKDYTIVGIFTGPNWSGSNHGINADTILVPKASVPNADKYIGPSLPLLNTVIIENGSIDAFEAHMAANDKAGAYLYFDQGYTEAASSVQTLIDNAIRIVVVGISMFMLSSLLFLLLYIRRAVPIVRTMRLLGVSARKTWTECFTSLIGQVAIAVLIGNALAVALYDRITQLILSASLELSYGNIALCGAVQFLLLFVAGIIWTRSVANRNLMQKR